MLTKCIKCLYDPVSIGFKCKCKEVIPSSCHTQNWNDWNVLLRQGFTDNGMACRPLESCVDNGNIFTKALCAWNLEGYYGYRCREGFRGDGYDGQGDCSWPFNPTFVLFLGEFSYTKTRWEVSSNQSRHVYIYPACAIQSAKSPSMPGRPIFVHNFQATAGKINNYIIYETGGFIFTPEGIAIDWASRNRMCRTASMRDTVEVANLGSNVRRKRVFFEKDEKEGGVFHPLPPALPSLFLLTLSLPMYGQPIALLSVAKYLCCNGHRMQSSCVCKVGWSNWNYSCSCSCIVWNSWKINPRVLFNRNVKYLFLFYSGFS